jgi:hypothetical protein
MKDSKIGSGDGLCGPGFFAEAVDPVSPGVAAAAFVSLFSGMSLSLLFELL